MSGKTIQNLIDYGIASLLPVSQEDAKMDCIELISFATGFSSSKIFMQKEDIVPLAYYNRFLECIERRKNNEPLQYILGEWEFYGLTFTVGEGVLIPRPETELIVDIGLNFLKNYVKPTVLDLCSGSGCIPIALEKNNNQGHFYCLEYYNEAFGYLKKNIGDIDNVTAVQGDFFNLPHEITKRKYDLITSNPPYIKRKEIATLQKEVQMEPLTALDGGTDGLDFYQQMPKIAHELLSYNGILVVEIGETQAEEVTDIFKAAGFNTAVKKDLSGNDRVVLASMANLHDVLTIQP